MLEYFNTLFRRLTPLQVAANELTTAELELLASETSVEYAVAMVAFNKSRVKRLKAYLAALAVEKAE